MKIQNLKYYSIDEKLGINLFRGNKSVQISDHALKQINEENIEDFWIAVEYNEKIVAVFKDEKKAFNFMLKHQKYPLYLNYDWLLLYD